MYNFYSASDVELPSQFVDEAIKYKHASGVESAKGKTLVMIFFNASLRTRLSTEIAAKLLGMHVISMNIADAWGWEIEDGNVMRFDTVEHIKDAARVISTYADVIAIRAFPGLKDRDEDYGDRLVKAFIRHSRVPVINMESAIRHPLQSLADMMTIKENTALPNPKIVLSWAPHVKSLPQAVSNSFLEWCRAVGYKVVITHPVGYDLAEEFTDGHTVEYDREKALAGADIVYLKNWSSYLDYGQVLCQDTQWTLTENCMSQTNNAGFMHCLPLRRNLVATDSVIDSDSSLVYAQAENRLHAAKFVLDKIIQNG